MTPQQEYSLIEFREECLNWGLCTDPADRQTSEKIFKHFYKRLNKKEPTILWFNGPATGWLAALILKNQLGDQLGDQLRDQLGDQLWGQLRDQLGDQLRDQLGDQLGDQLRDQLWGQLRDQLRGQLRDQLWGQLRDQLRGQLRGQLRDQLWGQLRDRFHFGGQHEIYLSAFYFWPQSVGLCRYSSDQLELLTHWLTLSKSCGWWEPYENMVIACERPLIQQLDEKGKLHGRPAILCRDGLSVFADHGVVTHEHPLVTATAAIVASL